jgi:hypothetical protein
MRDFSRASMERKRKMENGSPLRETSAAHGHGHVMVFFCLLAWEERKCVFAEACGKSHDMIAFLLRYGIDGGVS